LGASPNTEKAEADSPLKPKLDDKIAALRATRRSKGLCMKCGEIYNPQHRCPKQVPLHVLEELWELCADPAEGNQSEANSTDSEEEVLTLSYSAMTGIQGKKTMRLHGTVNQHNMLILIDSGSSSTFICDKLVAIRQLQVTSVKAVQVTVADGGKINSDKMIVGFSWWTQGHQFTSQARVLPLGCYDMILGMDWLEKHSPMWVDWKRKKMRFFYQDRRITLTGVKECTSTCLPVKSTKLTGLLRHGKVAQLVHLSALQEGNLQPVDTMPVNIAQMVQQYDFLFQDPKQLPPSRPFDHSIPLIKGVQPVNVKPYRYSPTQKDEIERQVKEMLLNGVIQPSSSPFASPVLLVKKKDGSWRFCVDYHHLNAITIKNKYPMPIVEELLDELSGGKWFTKLDMRSGYHQTRVQPADEHKTAFKTHSGHWNLK
jgi:hypothetical protein